MSKKRMFDPKFWSDTFIVDVLNPLDKLLYLYLLLNEHTNLIGIYELSIRTAAFETGIDRDQLEKMLERLSPKIEYLNGYIYIRRFTDYQMANPNITLGMEREVAALPARIKQTIIKNGISSERLAEVFNKIVGSSVSHESLSKPLEESESVSNTKLNLTKLNLTKPNKPTAPKSPAHEEISKLFYEVIKAHKLPKINNTNNQKWIKQMTTEAEHDKLKKYLLFLRDQYLTLEFDFKPHINSPYDIYSKRVQIENAMKSAIKEAKSKEVFRV